MAEAVAPTPMTPTLAPVVWRRDENDDTVTLGVERVGAAPAPGQFHMLWAFGVWWIPILVIFGLWRHAVKRYPVRYESELWSMVFPLGMFSVASIHLGKLLGLPVVHDMGVICTWIAGAAWLAVTVMMVRSASQKQVPGETTTEKIAHTL